MANAQIGNYVFDINPSKASWTYKLNIASQDTYGGRVVQLLSCRIEKMQVSGYLTQRGTAENQWVRMEEFERKVRDIMEWHAANKKPLKFYFPALEWSGDVYLTGYSNVKYDSKTAAVSYTLMMNVDSGFETIKEHASTEGLDVIPDGIGWVRNEYNTPTSEGWSTVKEALKKVLERAGTFNADNPPSIYQYIDEISATENQYAINSEIESAIQKAKGGSTALFDSIASNVMGGGISANG